MQDDRTPLASGSRGFSWRDLFRVVTWKELAFHVVHLPISVAGFCWFFFVTTAGPIIAATGFGLPVAAGLFRSTDWVATPTRFLSARLLGCPVATAPRSRARATAATFRDASAGRAYAYSCFGFALTFMAVLISCTTLGTAVIALTLPLQQYLPLGFERTAFTSTSAEAIVSFAGIIALFIWPAMNHSLARAQVFVISALLGPTATELRLADVAASRAASLESADARLRRIERDLHDGTQARLVNLAIILGDALDRVRRGTEPVSVEPQLVSAVAVTTETLAELRALVRDIYPPVLESGLDAALRSAVGRAGLPVQLHTDVPERPSPVVESIVYFAVLELLTNVHKHAGATTASVDVRIEPYGLVAEVQDNGRGGADTASDPSKERGTGLAGLRDRVRAVDGEFMISSPAGGPTIARIVIPEEGRP